MLNCVLEFIVLEEYDAVRDCITDRGLLRNYRETFACGKDCSVCDNIQLSPTFHYPTDKT
jgi:hypothetical protein